MTPPKIPNNVVTTYHSVAIDGSEIDVTRFYEHIKNDWIKNNESNLSFKNIKWDNGNDILSFETNSQTINLVALIQEITVRFPTAFFTYDFYTENNPNSRSDNLYWIYDGNINMKKDNLNRDVNNAG